MAEVKAERGSRPVHRVLRDWSFAGWETASYGARNPARIVLVLTLSGVISGLGETAIVVLLITLAAGGSVSLGGLGGFLPQGTGTLASLALLAVAMVAVAHWLAASASSRASADVRETVQKRLLAAWFDTPWRLQASTPPAELQHLVGVDVTSVAQGTQTAGTVLTSAIHLVVVLIGAFIIGPVTVLALAAAMSVVLALGQPVRSLRRRLAQEWQVEQRAFAMQVAEYAGATRELRVFGVVPRALERLTRSVVSAAAASRRLAFAGQLGPYLVRDVTIALVIVGLAGVQATTDVTLSGLGATVLLLLRALSHAQIVANSGGTLQERAVQRDRIESVLREWAPEEPRGTGPAPDVPAVSFEGVAFRHLASEKDALTDVTLELAPGELVGVIGRSGAGKTTFASLLLGLFTPARGTVRVDGVDLREIDPELWHEQTAWVGQEPHMVSGSVAANIRLLRDGIGDAAVLRAAQDAGLARELEQWPDGLAHEVGPRGTALSGGQRQRVAIARALAGGPRVLVLDEPTSALDVHAEATIRDLLSTLRGRALVVVIAHRISTLRACDRVAIFDDGRLTRLARPTELREDEAYFREVLALSSAEPL